MIWRGAALTVILAGDLAGCSADGMRVADPGGATTGLSTSGADDGGSTGGDEPPAKLDLAPMMDVPAACEVEEHTPCDDGDSLENALGLGCAGEWDVEVTPGGAPEAVGVRSSFGNTNAFDPTEGARYVALGTYRADALDAEDCPYSGDIDEKWSTCGEMHDPMMELPMPLVAKDAGPDTCAEDPAYLGNGDCSNTIETQFYQGAAGACPGANDYAEIRIRATVPPGVTSLSFDVAFLSKEYPTWYGSQWNDMFVAWLESSTWTGNVSFDGDGNPLSLNAGFLDFRDGGGPADPDCPTDTSCSAPELEGSCMAGHAATRWLTSTAPVEAGDEIELVFAIFDVADSNIDSYVFLDNVRWGCGEGPPNTNPA